MLWSQQALFIAIKSKLESIDKILSSRSKRKDKTHLSEAIAINTFNKTTVTRKEYRTNRKTEKPDLNRSKSKFPKSPSKIVYTRSWYSPGLHWSGSESFAEQEEGASNVKNIWEKLITRVTRITQNQNMSWTKPTAVRKNQWNGDTVEEFFTCLCYL